MKVSLKAIKGYAKEVDLTTEEIADRIKEGLAEVEEVEDLNKKYENISIAEIVKKEKHPTADKLGIYQIDTGAKKKVQVVAGDKTLEKGDKVVYLPPGVTIPHNPEPNKFDGKIKKVKLRGIESEGMLASESELGLSNDHKRVMIINTEAKAGTSFAEIAGLDNYIFEVENKPLTIRPETFGHIGFAREVAGIFQKPFETPKWFKNPQSIKPQEPSKESLPIKVDNKLEKLCPRYMAISMENIKVQNSPLWLKALLASVGIKSINNVVDITNYIMITTGQPLHAFDYDKLISKDIHAEKQAFITVRTAKQGEKIATLDGKTVELNEQTITICDSQNPIAIGGMMGGLDTEVDENTKNIIIESANFDLYNIRKNSMELGIFTEAVTRYSKGQDPNICEPSLYKAIEMIQEISGGKIASKIQDEHTELPTPQKVTFSVKKLRKHTNLNLSKDEIVNILSNIEIPQIKTKSGDWVTLEIPTYRQDIKIPADIHEEVSRLYGYKNIEFKLPSRKVSYKKTNPNLETTTKIRNVLKSMGSNEVLTYNFVGGDLYQKCDLNIENNFRITNPLSPELEYLRTTLLPSLLEKVNLNINNGYEEFSIFEINRTHNKLEMDPKERLPKETRKLSLLFTKDISCPYYHAKYYLDTLLQQLNTAQIEYKPIEKVEGDKFPINIKIIQDMFDINRTAVITSQLDKKEFYLGIIGEPNLEVQKQLKLKKPVGMFEIDLDNLQKIVNLNTDIINFSKYPKIQQDMCFVLNKEIPYEIVKRTIEKALDERNINYIVKPIDIYQKEGNLKQITLQITIQHKEKTLKDKDIKSIRDLIEKRVFKETKGTLKKE